MLLTIKSDVTIFVLMTDLCPGIGNGMKWDEKDDDKVSHRSIMVIYTHLIAHKVQIIYVFNIRAGHYLTFHISPNVIETFTTM